MLRSEATRHPNAFRPETFFLGRTEGWGLVRAPTGRIHQRFQVTTEGALDSAYQAVQFTETFAWDNGETDIWRWIMRRGIDGRYMAAETLAGAGIQGRFDHDGDYLLSFRRPANERGGPRFRFNVRFSVLAADVALKTARLSLLGLPLGTMTAIHRRLD